MKAAQFGRSERLRVGDWVLAIGNPFGFGGTVTAGIVSALDRDINSGPYDHYIQTDASINRGNSGGPLFNIDGEVVGINTAIMSPTGGSIGIGFAVPSEIAVPVIEQLRRFGEVRRGWIGVRIQDVTEEVAEGLGMDEGDRRLHRRADRRRPRRDGRHQGRRRRRRVQRQAGRRHARPAAARRRHAAGRHASTSSVMRDGERVTLKIEVGLLEDEKVAAADAPPDARRTTPGTAPPADDAAQMFGLSLGAITDEARKTFRSTEAWRACSSPRSSREARRRRRA